MGEAAGLFVIRRGDRWWDLGEDDADNRDSWEPTYATACHFVARAPAQRVADRVGGEVVELGPRELPRSH